MILHVQNRSPLKGTIRPPGDKSLSHRALMFGALAEGETHVRGLLDAEDIQSTAHCLREMGVPIWEDDDLITVEGRGDSGLAAPARILDTGNSGTTMRLLMGIIASYPFTATLTGDASLRKRPMDRIAIPLRQMGAQVEGQGDRCLPPVTVHGGALRGIEYRTPMASAQVKSAILLAGLRADGETRVYEPGLSRDHTERMLRQFGVQVESGPGYACVKGRSTLIAQDITVPGDFSAAAFHIAGAAIVAGSEVTITEVGLNPTRTGMLDVLQMMGADISITPDNADAADCGGEPVGSILVKGHRGMHGCLIEPELIPRLIDELPVICIVAACAEGETIVRGAEELRVKESDRLGTMAAALHSFGVDVEELPDGMIIRGGRPLQSAEIVSRGDHRIAMAGTVAGLVSPGVTIIDAECIATSYPKFTQDLRALGASVTDETATDTAKGQR